MILPSFVGIVINHFKDPYLKTSILDTTRVFFVAQLIYWYACDAWSKKISFSVKLTFSHLKIDGWKTIRLPFGSIFCLFSGANLLLVFGGVPFKQLFGNLGVTLQHAFLGKNIDPNHTRKGTDKKQAHRKWTTPSPVCQEYEYAFLWYTSLEMYQSLIVCLACEMMK